MRFKRINNRKWDFHSGWNWEKLSKLLTYCINILDRNSTKRQESLRKGKGDRNQE